MQIEHLVAEHDRTNFLNWLRDFPQQVEAAIELGEQLDGRVDNINKIYIGGMGGSGITGDLLAGFLYENLRVPVRSIRHYSLPAAVDRQTLFIAISYSGNTEETVSLFKAAGRAGAARLVVSSGGELTEQAELDPDSLLLTIPSGQPPRASAPYLFIPLIYWLDRLDLARAPGSDAVTETLEELEKITEELAPSGAENPALSLAGRLHDKINLLYGSQPLTAPLALRLKNQFNENAKMMAFANELPELNHNEIMGWRQLADETDSYRVVFLRDFAEHPRVQKRFDITAEIVGEQVQGIDQLAGRGESRFSRFMTLMLYSDYVSYYCALLRGEDPSEIESIELLKRLI